MASLPAVKGAADEGGAGGGGAAIETSASAPNVQIKAIDPKAEAVDRKSMRLKRQADAKARKQQLEKDYEKEVASKIEEKQVRAENNRNKAARAKMQTEWLKIIPYVLWGRNVNDSFREHHDTLQAGRVLTRTARKSFARSKAKTQARREFVINRLDWRFRLQARVVRRKLNARIVRRVARAGLFGPQYAPPDEAAAAAAAKAAELDVLAPSSPAQNTPQQMEYTFRMSILKLPLAVIKAQRLARGFIACKKARLQSMYLLRQHLRRQQRLMAQRALMAAADGGVAEIKSPNAGKRGVMSPKKGRSRVASRNPSRAPSRAPSRPGSPPGEAAQKHGEDMKMLQRQLRSMNARVLKSIQTMEVKHNLQSIPVGDGDDEEHDGSSSGKKRAMKVRRISQISCIDTLEQELVRRRKAFILRATKQHADAVAMYRAQLQGVATIDTAKMAEIMRLSPKKSMHRQLMRRASTVPMPRWPTFTLFSEMASDPGSWVPTVAAGVSNGAANTPLSPIESCATSPR